MEKSGVIISIFGSSRPQPEDSDYQEARWLGRAVGEAGWTVMTGGYSGIMEAVSRGAAEAGGHVIGVTCDDIEEWRPLGPNDWVMEERRFPTTRERLFALVEDCHGAVVLPGGIGTLAEASFMWSQIQTQASPLKPLILVGSEWRSIFEHIISAMEPYIARDHTRYLSFAPDVRAALDRLKEQLNYPG